MNNGTDRNASAKSVGIKDVAQAAGVSITTVSHALNDKGRLSDATRERVRAVARRLGYQPNATARHLAGGRTGLIELVLNAKITQMFVTEGLTFHARVMAVAAATCIENGYSLALAGTAQPGRTPDVRPDGVLGIDPVVGEPIWERLDALGVPVVTIGRILDRDESTNWVDNDHRASARLVFKHLSERGAKRIALIGTDLEASFEHEIRSEYDRWCAERGQAAEVVLAQAEFLETAGEVALRQLMDLPEPPDAVFATASRLAIGVLRACKDMSIAVPEEMMLVAGNDNQLALWAQPPFTTVDVAPEVIGRRSVELLIEKIEAQGEPDGPVIVPVRLIERESTARTRVD
jgi:DNA-binding LacI/PurR family transcriptional regulator